MRTIGLACISGLLCLGACSNDNGSSTAPTITDYDDVAQAVGASTAPGNGGGDVGSMQDAADISLGVVPLGFALSGSGSIQGAKFGLTYDYSATCTDALGNSLSVCGPTTNDATVSVDWSGNLTLPNLTAMVTRDGDWTLTGLQSNTATLNGDGTFTFQADLGTGAQARSWDLSFSSNYDAVMVQRSPRMVVGGSIHDTIDAQRKGPAADGGTSDASFHVDGVLTFHADGSATLVLDGTNTYSITASGAVSRS